MLQYYIPHTVGIRQDCRNRPVQSTAYERISIQHQSIISLTQVITLVSWIAVARSKNPVVYKNNATPSNVWLLPQLLYLGPHVSPTKIHMVVVEPPG